VAMVSLLTAAGIGGLNVESPEQYLAYALTLAFLVGLIQFGMGIFRLGFVVNFLSHPVISGFTSAAAIIIGLSQVKHLLRIPLPNSEHVQEIVAEIFKNLHQIHWLTFGIGMLGILVIKYGKKIHASFPSALIAVILGIILVVSFNLVDSGIKIVGNVPEGLPSLSFPLFDFATWKVLFPTAITISLVGFAESFAIAKAIQNKHKNYRLNANQELLALGIANFGASLFKGYPVTGGFSRTAINNEAGAKTTLASIFSATLIILTLLFFTDLFYYLPNAILAAVVIVAVAGLVDFKEPFHLFKKDKSDFALLIVTFIITLTLGIETGIIAGMILSLLVVIYRASRPHMAQLGRVPKTNIFRNIKRFSDLEVREDVLMVRIDGPIYFANLEFIKDQIDELVLEKEKNLKLIVLNLESVPSLDSSGAHELTDWIINWKKNGLNISISSAKGPLRDAFEKWGLIQLIGVENVFLDEHSAIEDFDKTLDPQKRNLLKPYAIQTNG
jgi:sulfate permease, SulP family